MKDDKIMLLLNVLMLIALLSVLGQTIEKGNAATAALLGVGIGANVMNAAWMAFRTSRH